MRDYVTLLEKCGDCDHIAMSHISNFKMDMYDIRLEKIIWNERCHVTHDGPIKLAEQCRCNHFVPKDNLERIEWLAKERNLI